MLLFFLLPLPAFLQLVAALQTNITLDDVSPMIKYAGQWEPSSSHRSGLDFGGSHTFSSDAAGSATFTFTGVAIYYLSPRWPYDVSTRLSLDGGAPVLVNLTDPATSPSAAGGAESALTSVVWSATGLANTSHTLVATMGNSIIMDGLIYTADNGLPPVSSSSSSASSSASSSSSSTTTSSSSTLARSSSQSASATLAASSSAASVVPSRNALTIGLATAFSLTVFFAALFLAFALYQRRRFRRARSARPSTSVLDDWGSAERGRGAYAAVEMAEPSVRLVGGGGGGYASSGSGLSDPWEPGEAGYYAHGQTPSHASSSLSAASSPHPYGLPPGASAPVVPGPYTDRAPPTPHARDAHSEQQLLSPSEGLSRAASSAHIRFAPIGPSGVGDAVSIGSGNGVRVSTPAPPAYSERCPSR